MSDLHRYTTFKVRRELGDLADSLIEVYRDKLGVYGMDNRSGFVTYLLISLAKHHGLVVDPDLRDVYPELLQE